MKKAILLILMVFSLSQWAQAQTLIEDFETWNTYMVNLTALEEPVGWSGTDSFIVAIGPLINPSGTFQKQIFQENPGQSGTGALRVATKPQDAINAGPGLNFPAKDYPGVITNAQIAIDPVSGDISQSGGAAITITPASTSMYVKNTVVMGDSTFISALIIDDSDGADSIMATADTILTGNITAFTKITLPFNYLPHNGLIPTVVRYTISSGNPAGLLDTAGIFSIHDGTEIVIDNIEISGPTGIRQLINNSPIAKVYPTTESDVLHIDLLKETQHTSLKIYTMDGKLIKETNLNQSENQVSISDLSQGSYIYSLSAEELIYQTGKFVH